MAQCANPKIYEVIEGRVIPDWNKFISSGENKQSLIRFLGDYIVKHINQNSSLQEGQSLYGRSLSGLPNCAIFRKTLTTVPTNDFLTTCKH
jgi:hypothetical protein